MSISPLALVSALLLSSVSGLHADFSYITTIKTTGIAGERIVRISGKGNRLKSENGDIVTITDKSNRTATIINHARKTVTVRSAGDGPPPNPIDMKAQVKETGQKKIVNGYEASEILMVIDTTVDVGRGPSTTQMEVSMWMALNVPGVEEMRTLSENPLPAAGASGVEAAIAEASKKIASMKGVAVQTIVRTKLPQIGAPTLSNAQTAEAQNAMAKARATLEAMAKAGGPGAAIAQQQLAKMPPPTSAAPSNSLEMTMDMTNFSTAAIPDSAFDIPAGYAKIVQ